MEQPAVDPRNLAGAAAEPLIVVAGIDFCWTS
jgi:hypothetical protein